MTNIPLENAGGKKNREGIALVAISIVILVLVLAGYAANRLIVARILSDQGVASALKMYNSSSIPGVGKIDAAQTVNAALALLGLIALLGSIILFPAGIVLIVHSRRPAKPAPVYDERSGKGKASVIPPELGSWNWGAAFMNIWWGMSCRVWISFLALVPFVNYFWWVVLGFKGDEWAWRKKKWVSVAEFKKAQKKWMIWAIVSLALTAASIIVSAVMLIAGLSKLGGGNSSQNDDFNNTLQMIDSVRH